MTSTAGVDIYKAFVPTLKMMITIAIGFIVTKAGMFPPASAKGVSTISLNIGLPALIFSSTVTAFTPQNISAFGSLAVVAILYEVIGGLLGLITRELFYVPADFQWGILVMGILSNWGNLPLATVQVLAQAAPFNGEVDVDLGLAYVSVSILIMQTCLWPLGMHKLCALDFKEANLQKDRLPIRERWSSRFASLKQLFAHSQTGKNDRAFKENFSSITVTEGRANVEVVSHEFRSEKRPSLAVSEPEERGEELAELRSNPTFVGGAAPTRKTSRTASFTSMLGSTRSIPATAPLDATDLSLPCPPSTSAVSGVPTPLLPVCSNHGDAYSFHRPATPVPSVHKSTLFSRVLSFLRGMLIPVSLAVIIGIPCAIVLPLKALFVETPGWTGTRMPNAPDGNPPLNFILVTATFLGGMTVPATLVLLGASFARLKMPSSWRQSPIAAIVSMTVCKMILVPIFGIFVVQAFRDDTSLFPPSDRIRTFVAIIISGTPAAVNQLVITQLYNPAGSAHTLAMFLCLQYICMPVLSTALAAIALYIVEQQ